MSQNRDKFRQLAKIETKNSPIPQSTLHRVTLNIFRTQLLLTGSYVLF